MYGYREVEKWSKELKLKNLVKGVKSLTKIEPVSLVLKLYRFILVLTAMIITKLWINVFEVLVIKYTRYNDPRALPDTPSLVSFWACGISATAMVATPILAIAHRYEAIGTLVLAIALCAFAGQWLRRRVP